MCNRYQTFNFILNIATSRQCLPQFEKFPKSKRVFVLRYCSHMKKKEEKSIVFFLYTRARENMIYVATRIFTSLIGFLWNFLLATFSFFSLPPPLCTFEFLFFLNTKRKAFLFSFYSSASSQTKKKGENL